MRNRQVGPDEAAAVLAELIPRITYKDWSLSLREVSRGQGCEGLTLIIEASVPDTTPGSSETITFAHLFPVLPAAYNEANWTRWVLECLIAVEQHEALEWFCVDGERPYFPSHAPGENPYTVERVNGKTTASAYAPAAPWLIEPARDPHFDDRHRPIPANPSSSGDNANEREALDGDHRRGARASRLDTDREALVADTRAEFQDWRLRHGRRWHASLDADRRAFMANETRSHRARRANRSRLRDCTGRRRLRRM